LRSLRLSPWLALLLIVPVVNIVLIIYLAIKR
jgi:hypothetical protein